MLDPLLDSVHLELPRRQEFRLARDMVLDARGEQTMAGERRQASRALDQTALQACRAQPSACFVLMDRESTYPLKVGVNTVGRLPDNDVVLQDPYVSRRHCAILGH